VIVDPVVAFFKPRTETFFNNFGLMTLTLLIHKPINFFAFNKLITVCTSGSSGIRQVYKFVLE
jgi:hypothetical protein